MIPAFCFVQYGLLKRETSNRNNRRNRNNRNNRNIMLRIDEQLYHKQEKIHEQLYHEQEKIDEQLYLN